MSNTKPVTVHTKTVGVATPVQQAGLDLVVDYLTDAICPGLLVPPTGRIVIEWGDEEALKKLRDD